MKKRIIRILSAVAMIAIIVFGYQNLERISAENYVKEFLQLSYNCESESIEGVLQKQADFYENTMKQMYEKSPPIDVGYIKETRQEMKIVSEIQTTVKEDVIGNKVVHADFVVQFKDVLEPDGFTQELQLDFTLVRTGICTYQISYIGG